VKTISAEVILSNVLAVRKWVKISTLNRMAGEIRKQTELYPEVTRDDLVWTCQDKRPDLFEWVDGEIIRRAKDFNRYFLDGQVNWEIPAFDRERVIKILRKK
jgi:hypothetical protein